MNRISGRTLATTTLEATTTYAAVYDHEPVSFDGVSPVATVHSKSLGLAEGSHGEIVLVGMLWVSLYVRHAGQSPELIEDEIDALVRAAALALRGAFAIQPVAPTIAPSEGGYRLVDGTLYRVEQFAIRVEEELEVAF